ncbi:siderophore-interacting protein [Aliikangiella coralliicola]|uniref:Siderophore-interacting protein n=1 Tax=Aliikangiella coralliicola TaxID=2592383 RepID=A0A545UCA6_9GAMM|nr:siderophore-interacting protein [Aliikangiella coralliicola]TQV87102.1 siderophore-interacting protein [Aliikangiella coralliicola]
MLKNKPRKNLYKPSSPKLLQVEQIVNISPRLRRLRLTGEQLKDYPKDIPAAHIKIFLPLEGQVKPVLPTMGQKGIEWPDKSIRPMTRTYSVRGFYPEDMILDIDFALHGDEGPASRFALNAKRGDYIGVSSPGGPYPMLPDAEQFVFAGDITAIPAISALLETLPSSATGHAFLEVPCVTDIHELQHPPQLKIHWLVRQPGPSPLLNALKTIGWSQADPLVEPAVTQSNSDDVFFWVGGENDAVLAIRKYLKEELQIHRKQIYAVPYWKNNLSEEGYHSERHEVMDQLAQE